MSVITLYSLKSSSLISYFALGKFLVEKGLMPAPDVLGLRYLANRPKKYQYEEE